MAGVRAGFLKLNKLSNFHSHASKIQSFQSHNTYTRLTRNGGQTPLRSSYLLVNRGYRKDELSLAGNMACGHRYNTQPIAAFLPGSSNLHFISSSSFVSSNPMLIHRSYSSSSVANDGKPGISEAASGGVDSVNNNGIIRSDWFDKVKDLWQNTVDAVTHTGQKAKEVSDGLTPYAQQVLDAHPYLQNVVVPVGWTLTGIILAWAVMPKLLRRFHKYSLQTPAALLSGGISGEQIPYEKSFLSALEDPLRYLITFMAFSQMAAMVAPSTIALQYIAQAWRGAVILSFVWFLYRWKTNVISRTLAAQSLVSTDREKILTLDRVSSVALFGIGIMALAETCGVPVQSILTVGGVGGVATAFAARDILGNVLSGLSIQFSKPFSLGDTIKAGSVEGQVVEMGLTTTSLLSAEKFPVVVPNSLFSSQVIVNKSRAQWRAMISKIPITVDDVEKIPQISNQIKIMLKSNPKVFLEMEAPYCFLSRIETSFAELTLGCNLKHMRKDELYSTQQEILLQSVRIIKEHGAKLGSTWQDVNNNQ